MHVFIYLLCFITKYSKFSKDLLRSNIRCCSLKLQTKHDGTIRIFRGDYFQFSLVFIKQSNQTNFLNKKTSSNRFSSIFLVWLGFFPVWLGFFRFGFGSVIFFSSFLGLIGFSDFLLTLINIIDLIWFNKIKFMFTDLV